MRHEKENELVTIIPRTILSGGVKWLKQNIQENSVEFSFTLSSILVRWIIFLNEDVILGTLSIEYINDIPIKCLNKRKKK